MKSRLITIIVLLNLISPSSAQTVETLAVATDLLSKQKYVEAARILDSLAKSGNAEAQYRLGLLHYNGKGVAESEKTAISLLTSSAQQGNVDAMYQLGNVLTFGTEAFRLVSEPDIEAAKWYFKAAKLGNADAQYSLGLLFMAGKGLEKNEKEALYWMRQAANKGHKDASSYVAGRK